MTRYEALNKLTGELSDPFGIFVDRLEALGLMEFDRPRPKFLHDIYDEAVRADHNFSKFLAALQADGWNITRK